MVNPAQERQDLIQYKVYNVLNESVEIGARAEFSDRIWTTWSVQVRIVKGDTIDLRQFTVKIFRKSSDLDTLSIVLHHVLDHGVSLDVIHKPFGSNSRQPVIGSAHPDSPQEEQS